LHSSSSIPWRSCILSKSIDSCTIMSNMVVIWYSLMSARRFRVSYIFLKTFDCIYELVLLWFDDQWRSPLAFDWRWKLGFGIGINFAHLSLLGLNAHH
jgi:hypothetical protein